MANTVDQRSQRNFLLNLFISDMLRLSLYHFTCYRYLLLVLYKNTKNKNPVNERCSILCSEVNKKMENTDSSRERESGSEGNEFPIIASVAFVRVLLIVCNLYALRLPIILVANVFL